MTLAAGTRLLRSDGRRLLRDGGAAAIADGTAAGEKCCCDGGGVPCGSFTPLLAYKQWVGGLPADVPALDPITGATVATSWSGCTPFLRCKKYLSGSVDWGTSSYSGDYWIVEFHPSSGGYGYSYATPYSFASKFKIMMPGGKILVTAQSNIDTYWPYKTWKIISGEAWDDDGGLWADGTHLFYGWYKVPDYPSGHGFAAAAGSVSGSDGVGSVIGRAWEYSDEVTVIPWFRDRYTTNFKTPFAIAYLLPIGGGEPSFVESLSLP